MMTRAWPCRVRTLLSHATVNRLGFFDWVGSWSQSCLLCTSARGIARPTAAWHGTRSAVQMSRTVWLSPRASAACSEEQVSDLWSHCCVVMGRDTWHLADGAVGGMGSGNGRANMGF